MTTTPPGWYDDGHGVLRWWDGAGWTEHVATPDPEPAQAAGETAPADTSGADPRPGAAPRGDEIAEIFGAPPAELADTPDAPPGAPGATDAPAPPGGAFVAATEPTKSKAWIVWVIAGVVLLGIVIAAAVVIPLLFLSLATGGSSGSAPTGEDQTAAVAAVERYDEAWSEVDCDKYVTSTTDDFRTLLGLPDCTDFEPAATEFAATVSDYEVTIVSIEQSADDAIAVETVETYGSFFDDQGQPTDELVTYEDRYVYHLVPSADGWAIDSAD